MRMLYDSEFYAVVHFQTNADSGDPALNTCGKALMRGSEPMKIPRSGFEIVDKKNGKEVFLDGAWAELFQQHIDRWNKTPPSQEEIEHTLDRYAELAQMPLHIN